MMSLHKIHISEIVQNGPEVPNSRRASTVDFTKKLLKTKSKQNKFTFPKMDHNGPEVMQLLGLNWNNLECPEVVVKYLFAQIRLFKVARNDL